MSIEKYLAKYSEPETGIADHITSTYQYVLCIPAYAESTALIEKLKYLPVKSSVLVVLVINAPDQHADNDLLEQTSQLLEHCQSKAHTVITSGACLLELKAEPRIHILVIDRCSENRRIPYKQGVGLARKIAADIAVKLIADYRVSCPWLYFSDADVTISDGYFEATDSADTSSHSLLIYPFRHVSHGDPTVNLCQNLYDFSLYYYEQGLLHANSPYAAQTLGSILAVNASHYAQVRGVPKRNAGEDFHLINKLSKTGQVLKPESPVVEIETRLSSRVPYGTGPALNRLLADENPLENFEVYAPETFKLLSLTLTGLNSSYPSLKKESYHGLSTLFDELDNQETDQIITVLEALDTEEALLAALKNSADENSFQKHMTHWFDALKTLRFIHLARDKYFPSVPVTSLRHEPLYLATMQVMQQKGNDIHPALQDK